MVQRVGTDGDGEEEEYKAVAVGNTGWEENGEGIGGSGEAMGLQDLDGEDDVVGAVGSERGGEEDDDEDSPREYIIPTRTLKEIKPTESKFVTVPAVPKEQCPSAQEINTKLSEVGDGVEFSELPKSELAYVLSDRWLQKLSHFITAEDLDFHPGPIDNSDLFEDDLIRELPNLSKRSDYKLLSEEQWNLLVGWFGGGPALQKQFNERGNVMTDIRVVVVCTDDLGTCRKVLLPHSKTMGKVKEELCSMFEVDVETTRMYDYFSNKPHDLFDDPELKVREAKLLQDNFILLERPLKNGKYVVEMKKNRFGRRNFAMEREDKVRGSTPTVSGAVGLQNIGNTCYMNSTLQCLSNIPMLREYFTSDKFKDDINLDNPLGHKGKLAKAYGNIMNLMWNDDGDVCVPYGFKKLISEIKPEFAGYLQHDSQELLSCILDGLHEDLNRITVKPATEAVVGNGRPDEEVAVEALAVYKQRNDSKITDLFTGLFKSTVRCPDATCGNVSVTFDPYMILPLPLKGAEDETQQLHIIYVPENEWARVSKFNVVVPKHGPIYTLRQAIASVKGIPADHVLLCRVKRCRVVYPYKDHDDIAMLSSSDTLVAYENKLAGAATRNLIEYEFLLMDWRRGLTAEKEAQRQEEDEDDEDSDYGFERVADLSELEKIAKGKGSDAKKEEAEGAAEEKDKPIGFVGCPWVAGDVWIGNYAFEDSAQVARVEVETVEKTADGKFEVKVVFDTKVDTDQDREHWFTQTAFDATGLYEIREDALPPQQPGKPKKKASKTNVNRKVSSFFNRNKKKGASSNEEQKEDKDEEEVPSFDDECLKHGNIEFTPVGEPIFFEARSPNSYSDATEEREPVVVLGSVDHEHLRFWGSVKNTYGNPRGEFFLYRLKSLNWDTTLDSRTAGKRKSTKLKRAVGTELRPTGEFPKLFIPRPKVFSLEYYFVNMAHRRGARHYGHRLERYMYVPVMTIIKGKNVTEEEFHKDVTTNFKKLLQEPESEEVSDEELFETFDLVRANDSFETHRRRSNIETLCVGDYIVADSDDRLVLGEDEENNGMVYLTIQWVETCPFNHAIRTELLEVPNVAPTMDIDYALSLFGQEEKLNAFNSWYCRKCKQHQEAYKKLEIWSVPPVLVVQFKRFSQEEGRNRADKLETLVDYPVNNLDMTKYVRSKEGKEKGNYDLVGVSCHHGALGMGHYTAFARNEKDGAWYKFDDSRVSRLPAKRTAAVVDPDAYVLFYLRKDVQPEIFRNPPPVQPVTQNAQPQEESTGTTVTILQEEG